MKLSSDAEESKKPRTFFGGFKVGRGSGGREAVKWTFSSFWIIPNRIKQTFITQSNIIYSNNCFGDVYYLQLKV